MAETTQQGVAFDSDRQQLGDVYARALLAAAISSESVEEVMQQAESLCHDLLANTPKIRQLLESPRISHEEKKDILDKAFAAQMNTTLLNFLKVLSRHANGDGLTQHFSPCPRGSEPLFGATGPHRPRAPRGPASAD